MLILTAFQFCVKFERKKEFRQLCDTLRKHIEYIEKGQTQLNAVNLSNPESLQIHLETRLAQLTSAMKLDLWQVSPGARFELVAKAVRPASSCVALSIWADCTRSI
jgi:hypothetical protein